MGHNNKTNDKFMQVNGIIYTEPEFFGVIPVKQDIEILPADGNYAAVKEPPITINSTDEIKNNDETIGWSITEILGLSTSNLRAVSKLQLYDEDEDE